MPRFVSIIAPLFVFSLSATAAAEERQAAPKREAVVAKVTTPRTASAAKPSDPGRVLELKVQPSKLVLTGPTDSRRLLISAQLATGAKSISHAARS